jgi:hypothetical protein
MPEQVTSGAEAVQTSISNMLDVLAAAVPNVIGFLMLLGAGWLMAGVIARLVAAILIRVRFNDWVHRSGLGTVLANAGADMDAIGFVALTAKWFIRLIALVVAFDALGLPAVSETLRQLLLWLPNLVAALVILVIGGLGANALHGLVRASLADGDFGNPKLPADLAWAGVWTFAILAAVYQVGIASELVTTVVMALAAGLALAVGLAFGLGARDTAGEIVRDVYERWRNAAADDGLEKERPLARPEHRPSSRREH